MEVVGAASAVIAVLTIAKDVVEIGLKIKSSYAKIGHNSKRLEDTIDRVADALEQLQGVIQGSAKHSPPSGLQAAMTSLRADLRTAYRSCQELVQSTSGPKILNWKSSDATARMIEAIEKRVAHCLQLFTSTTCARIERTLGENDTKMHDRMERVEESLRRLLAGAESNPVKAVELFAMSSMDSAQLTRVMNDVQLELRKPISSLERRYLEAKIKVIRQHLQHIQASRARPRVQQDRKDSVDDVGHVIRTFSRKRDSAALEPRGDVASSLDKLSSKLHEKGLYDDASEMSCWAVAIYRQLVDEHPDGFSNRLRLALRNHCHHIKSRRQSLERIEGRGRDDRHVNATPGGTPKGRISPVGMPIPRVDTGKIDEEMSSRNVPSLQQFRQVFAAGYSHELDTPSLVTFPRSAPASYPQNARIPAEAGQVQGRATFTRRPALGPPAYALRAARSTAQLGPRRTVSSSHLACDPKHAQSLMSRADMLMESEDFASAFHSVEEAVAQYRQLVLGDAGRFSDRLAVALNNASICLRRLDRSQKAAAFSREAVQLFQGLARAEPTKYQSDLAVALHTWSSCLAAQQKSSEALNALTDVVSIRRNILSQSGTVQPTAHLQRAVDGVDDDDISTASAKLALALVNRSCGFRELRRASDALRDATEASSLYDELRTIGVSHIEVLESHSRALEVTHLCLDDEGRHEDALRNGEQCVLLRRSMLVLSDGRRERSKIELAQALMNCFHTHRKLRRSSDALRRVYEAVHLYRGTHSENLFANSVHHLSTCYLDVPGYGAEALTSAKEAVTTYRSLSAFAGTDKQYDNLANSLLTATEASAALGLHKAACQAGEEALEIHRRLAREAPTKYLQQLRRTLMHVSTCNANIHDRGRSRSLKDEAQRLRSTTL